MGKSQLDKLGALTHARRYTHTHILAHLILLMSSNVLLNLRSEQEYTLTCHHGSCVGVIAIAQSAEAHGK